MQKRLKVRWVDAGANGGRSVVAHFLAFNALQNIERAYHNVNNLTTQTGLDIISTVVRISNWCDIMKAFLETRQNDMRLDF
jgi:hypothetical protein